MKNLAFLLAFIASSSSGFAQDAAPIGKWNGFQLGLQGGVGVLNGKDDVGGGGSVNSGIFGGFAGYTHSFNKIAFGVQGDVNLTNYNSTSSSGASRSRSRWNASATIRVGYDANRFLPYFSAGVGFAGYGVKRFADNQTSDNTHIGYVLGAGLEARIIESISARVDYKHTEMGEERYQFNGFTPFHIKGRQDVVTLGVAYNF